MIDKQVIFVFGMHRAGTSAIARVLSLCGASLPGGLLGSGEGNPTGHWEPLDAVELNDEFLNRHGSSWFDPTLRLQSEIILDKQERDAYVERIRALLEASASGPLLVMKEPRITTLWDFWFEAASQAGFSSKAVIAVRHPGEVAASLAIRDGSSFELSNALWLKYTLLAERHSRTLPRVFVEYSNLLDDWRHEVTRISEALSLDLSQRDCPRIEEFLRRDLRHQRSSGEPAEVFGVSWMGRVYNVLSEAARDSAFDLHVLDQVFSDYRACERAFRVALDGFDARTTSIAGFERWFGALSPSIEARAELERLQAELERLQAELERLQAERGQLQGELEQLRGVELAVREQQIASLNLQIADLRRELDSRVADHGREVAALNEQLQRRDGQVAALDRVLTDKLGRVLTEKEERNRAIHRELNQKGVEVTSLRQALADSRRDLDAANFRTEEIRQELSLMQASVAWRATEVVRRVFAPFPRVRRMTSRALRIAWWTITLQLPQRWRARRVLLQTRDEIAVSPLFDANWYLSQYPDVAAAGWDPALHYALFGAKEHYRNPGPQFDASWYLQNNPDVAAKSLNPLCHHIRWGASEKRAVRPVSAPSPAEKSKRDYDAWIKQYDTIADEDKVAIRNHITHLARCPLISVVMPVYDTNPVFLRKAIDSVLAQLYPNWELCIADDASPDFVIREILEEYAQRDGRIKIVFRTQNGHISAASNSALELASGEFVALMDHDDELAVHALYMIAAELNDHPETDIIYSDEDKIDAEDRRYGPYFKSDWNPELFYSQNMVNHLGGFRTALVRQVGGFREGFEGSQDYDLVLRLVHQTKPQRIRHIPFILYHWRLGDRMATFSTDRNEEAVAAARRALAEHFSSRGENVRVTASRVPYWHRIERFVPDPTPRVSLVVTADSDWQLLRNCIVGLLNGTDYPNLQIIVVDNGNHDHGARDYLAVLRTTDRVRVLNIDATSNFGAINNRAVREADGEIIGFISNKIEVIGHSWLREMVAQVVQPGVGAVGAKLYNRDDTVQHAGLVPGMTGVVGYPHRKCPRSAIGYYGQLQLVRNVSCVTSECMLVSRCVFEQVKGFDEVHLKSAYHDLDFCLAIRRVGYNVVWTPYSELYCLEPQFRSCELAEHEPNTIAEDHAYIERQWADQLKRDPFFSPNLSLESEDFSLAFPPRVDKPWLNHTAALLQKREPETQRPQANTQELRAELNASLRLARQQALVIQRLQHELHSTKFSFSKSADTNGAKSRVRLISTAVKRSFRALKSGKGSADYRPN